jgi:hypothetical protein
LIPGLGRQKILFSEPEKPRSKSGRSEATIASVMFDQADNPGWWDYRSNSSAISAARIDIALSWAGEEL